MLGFRDISFSFVSTLCCVVIVLSSTQVLAQVRSSSNYQLESDSINVGGGLGNSANFGLESTAGEVATGRSTSTNFSLQAGYQQLDEVFISLQMNAAPESSKSIEIIIQSSEVDSTLTDFPVYVNLADLGPEFWDDVTTDGRDIRVTTSDGVTETPFELVSIDTGAETGELHFKAPTISSSTDTSFFIDFGDSSLTTYAAGDTYGSENVWTNGYRYVSHDGGATDSTSNGNDGAFEGDVTNTATGQLGLASELDGSGDGYNMGNNAIVNVLNDITVSLWLQPDNISGTEVPMSKYDSSSDRGWLVGMISGGTLRLDGRTGVGSYQVAASPVPAQNNTWIHFAGTRNGATWQAYSNASTTGPVVNSSGSFSVSAPFVIGGLSESGVNDFDGTIDEVRLSQVARSQDWISAEYINQATSTTFYATSSATETFSGFALTPALPGLTGGASNGSTTFTVITDSPTGYEVTLQSEGAPAMQGDNGSSIPNYNNGDTADFAFTIPAASAVFGFSPEGVDIADAFLDNTTTCGSGSTDTPGACWAGASTTPITIAESTSSNQPNGATTTLQFQVGISSGGAVESGVYTATTTLTALPL